MGGVCNMNGEEEERIWVICEKAKNKETPLKTKT
jgi:hypothetical protein